MRIIAIDPGYDRCGVAILEGVGAPHVLFSGCITTLKKESHSDRLASIHHTLVDHILSWKPDALALETLFFSINKKTAIKVAEARGMILALAGLHALPVIELSPQEVKLSMTGSGNATKEQVQKMVQLSLKISVSNKIDDEVDAIALGVAALQHARVENFKKTLA